MMIHHANDDNFKEFIARNGTVLINLYAAWCGPSGLEGLAVRRWTCTGRGAEHDRDENAAQNIKQRGLEWLKKEFAAAPAR